MSFDLELDRDQVRALLEDTCPKCKDGWPVKWSNIDKGWFHQQQNVGNIRTTICLATKLRDKYSDKLYG